MLFTYCLRKREREREMEREWRKQIVIVSCGMIVNICEEFVKILLFLTFPVATLDKTLAINLLWHFDMLTACKGLSVIDSSLNNMSICFCLLSLLTHSHSLIHSSIHSFILSFTQINVWSLQNHLLLTAVHLKASACIWLAIFPSACMC